jgi:Retrotransposon gag protein
LAPTKEGYKTNPLGQLPRNHFGLGYWPEDHPKNPKNLVLATAPSFGDFILEGIEKTQAPAMTTEPTASSFKGKNKDEPEEGNGGSLRGKAPEVFNGDRTKSKNFISDLRIYFQINRNHKDVKNAYSRTLLALSFIKGPNVVNWVDQEFNRVNEDLRHEYGDDEEDDGIWTNFERRFRRNYISTTAKETAYVKLQNLKMKGGELDEYIADFGTLISELDWDEDSETACQYFRGGLPAPLVRTIISMEGNPDTLTRWTLLAQKHHSRWAMTKAFGYSGKKAVPGTSKPHFTKGQGRKERDPDAMDVDFTQMSPEKKKQLMDSGKCFRCEKYGHLARTCPTKKGASIQEVKEEPAPSRPPTPKKEKGKAKKDDPPSYDSLLKQINACSMEDRRKILEVFSQDGSDSEDF